MFVLRNEQQPRPEHAGARPGDRAYLDSEGIEYNTQWAEHYLLTLAYRRLHRIELEAMEDAAQAPPTPRYTGARSISQILNTIERLTERAEREEADQKQFMTIKGIIVEHDQDVVKLKHTSNQGRTACTGFVVAGHCTRCQVHTPGVLAYGFDALLQDCDNPMVQNSAYVSDKGGMSLTGYSAMEFNALSLIGKRDVLETIREVPVGMRAIVTYSRESGSARVVVWQGHMMPPPMQANPAGPL